MQKDPQSITPVTLIKHWWDNLSLNITHHYDAGFVNVLRLWRARCIKCGMAIIWGSDEPRHWNRPMDSDPLKIYIRPHGSEWDEPSEIVSLADPDCFVKAEEALKAHRH